MIVLREEAVIKILRVIWKVRMNQELYLKL